VWIEGLIKVRALVSAFTFPPESNGVANAAHTHAKILLELGCEVQVLIGGCDYRVDNVDHIPVWRFPVKGKGHFLSPTRGALQPLDTFLARGE